MPVSKLTVNSQKQAKSHHLWTTYDFPGQSGTRVHSIGETNICVATEQAGEGELLSVIAVYNVNTKKQAASKAGKGFFVPPMTDPGWKRMLVKNSSEYSLLPAYPDLPVCINIKEAFLLPPGAELEGWIFSRLEAQIQVEGSIVASFPLRKAHKTLFGQADTGVVCRYDEADFLAADEPLFNIMRTDPSLIAHPVKLKNSSQEAILVNELCIYGEQLSIFFQEAKMMSEKLSFVFSSSGLRMSLEGQHKASSDWEVLTRPRISGEERFRVRSVELFRAIARLSL